MQHPERVPPGQPRGSAQYLPPPRPPAHQTLLPGPIAQTTPTPPLLLSALCTHFCKPTLCQAEEMQLTPWHSLLLYRKSASDLSPQVLGLGAMQHLRFATLISDKGSMLSLLWEGKHKVCLLWAVCRVRCWLIAQGLLSRHNKECKMMGVCVGLGVDGGRKRLCQPLFLILTSLYWPSSLITHKYEQNLTHSCCLRSQCWAWY